MSKSVLAWHFLKETKLPHGDNRSVQIGKKLPVKEPIKICSHGLHGSIRLIDALQYAPGAILCRTKHTGQIEKQEDKLCSSERTVIWMENISNLLFEFGAREAEKALKDRRKEGYSIPLECDKAIQAGRDYRAGKITSAARSAAWFAAESAAWSAARSAQNKRLTKMVQQFMKDGTF